MQGRADDVRRPAVGVDLDALHLDQVREGAERFAPDVHVQLHRCGIWMDGDHGHPRRRFVDAEAVEQHLLLALIDEVNQLRDAVVAAGHHPPAGRQAVNL